MSFECGQLIVMQRLLQFVSLFYGRVHIDLKLFDHTEKSSAQTLMDGVVLYAIELWSEHYMGSVAQRRYLCVASLQCGN